MDDEALIGLRLHGERTMYVVRLSDVYHNAALQHANKEAAARKKARQMGIPWRIAKKQMQNVLKL